MLDSALSPHSLQTRLFHTYTHLYFFFFLLIASSLAPQTPNTARRPSSALRLVREATPYPRASAPRWTRPLMRRQGMSTRANVLPGRKHWSWSSAGSKGSGRRTAGLMTSRWAAHFSKTGLKLFISEGNWCGGRRTNEEIRLLSLQMLTVSVSL